MENENTPGNSINGLSGNGSGIAPVNLAPFPPPQEGERVLSSPIGGGAPMTTGAGEVENIHVTGIQLEPEPEIIRNCEFLMNEKSAKYFADADFALKSGRHVQNHGDDYKIWNYINEFYDKGLSFYYETLYGVYLRKDTSDRDTYYYLDFAEDNKGKFGYDRNIPVEDRHVVFGILLLNVYKEKFFEEKTMKWEDLEFLIEESEQKENWQKLLYGEVKRNYTPAEKNEMKRRVRRTLYWFEKIGWIRWINPEEIKFEILPSIDRLGKLYAREINHVDVILEYLEGGGTKEEQAVNPEL